MDKWRKYACSDSSKLQGDLNFAFDQRESEVNLHKATSSPSNVSPAYMNHMIICYNVILYLILVIPKIINTDKHGACQAFLFHLNSTTRTGCLSVVVGKTLWIGSGKCLTRVLFNWYKLSLLEYSTEAIIIGILITRQTSGSWSVYNEGQQSLS